MSDAKEIEMLEGIVYEYRAFFQKVGRAKYISHLDLYRTIQRSFKRAKLPVWHTQGYNPHIYLTFPLPIALGCDGMQECFDFRLCEYLSAEEVAARLNRSLPEGIVILRLAAPVRTTSQIGMADYTVRFSAAGLTPSELLEKWDAYMAQEEIPAQKRSKKGIKTVDLKPMIRSADREETEKGLLLRLTLSAGPEENLNPVLLADTFAEKNGLELNYQNICRNAVRCTDGEVFC